jgi:hypothetical protein
VDILLFFDAIERFLFDTFCAPTVQIAVELVL